MRSILLLVLALSWSPGGGPAFAENDTALDAGDRAAIQEVILKQLDAFQRDDEAEAFSYASPSIQSRFRTPAEFMRMVRSGYEAVYRPQSTHFLEAFVLDGQVLQPLEVVAPDASVVVAFYMMERQPDGTWRIAGCMLSAPEGRAA
jgi:hypothetical protein